MKVIETYQRKLNFRGLALLLLLFVMGMITMRYSANQVAAHNHFQAILDLRMGYSLKECQSYLSALGTDGRALYYTNFFYIDFTYMLIYTAFYFSTLLFLLKLFRTKVIRLILIFPLCGMIFDFGENLLIRHMAKNFPNISEVICQTSSIFTILKFICVYASLFFILISVILQIWQRVIAKS